MKKTLKIFLRSFIATMILTATLLAVISCSGNAYKTLIDPFEQGELTALPEELDTKLELLKKAIKKDLGGSNIVNNLGSRPDNGNYTVFLSISDAKSKARVFSANGNDLSKAFGASADKVKAYVSGNSVQPVWVKADVVISSEKVSASRIPELIERCKECSFKWGVSLDANYERAFLEAEINTSAMIDSTNKTFRIDSMNKMLSEAEKAPLDAYPSSYVFFYCKGYVCDENANVYKLESDIYNGYGRRITGTPDKNYALSIIKPSASYLARQVGADGRFAYGYYAFTGTLLSGYNSVRHAGTLWNMVRDYELVGGDELKNAIERGISYMLSEFVVYDDTGTAFFTNDKKDQISAGGCALALLALGDYSKYIDSSKYIDTARALANGLVDLHSRASESGYVHLLTYPEFTTLTEFSTIYYEGESTFALANFYEIDKNEKWINTACEALDFAVSHNYETYKDHWTAYSCNEVTKYVPKAEYFELGLKNVSLAMEGENASEGIHPTGFEMLTASFEMAERILQLKVSVNYPEGFTMKRLAEIIVHRADYDLCGFAYPEYAMYFSSPSDFTSAFFIRQSGYRVRIDDVQHMLGGYRNYYYIYDSVLNELK